MPKILVVDDEKVLVKGIKFNLENEGYQVEVGYDGEEAVEQARTGQFDLIILDLMMPKIDGLQACMKIREFSNVPVIMLTARGRTRTRSSASSAGRTTISPSPSTFWSSRPGCGPCCAGPGRLPRRRKTPTGWSGEPSPSTWTSGPPGKTAKGWT